jgi:hypothetical protein
MMQFQKTQYLPDRESTHFETIQSIISGWKTRSWFANEQDWQLARIEWKAMHFVKVFHKIGNVLLDIQRICPRNPVAPLANVYTFMNGYAGEINIVSIGVSMGKSAGYP